MNNNAGLCLLAPSAVDRAAYRLLLSTELEIEVDCEADFSPVSVWEAMRRRPARTLLVSDRLETAAHECVQMIIRLRPQTRVVVFSNVDDTALLQAWGRCRLDGYVLKSDGLGALATALEQPCPSSPYYSPSVSAALQSGRDQADSPPKLSRRELELLPLLARGLTLREAASRMTVSYKTADSYRTSLLRKLGVRDRVELARYAIREGIIVA